MSPQPKVEYVSEIDSEPGPRERILEVALELFTSKGFVNVEVGELCDGAGVTTDEFSTFFTSTLDVLKTLYRDISKAFGTEMLAAIDQASLNYLETLYAAIGAYMHSVLDDPRRILLVGIEVESIDAEWNRERRASRRAFGDMIQALSVTYQDQQVVQVGLARISYVAVVTAVSDMAIEYALMSPDERPSLEELIAEAVRFVKGVATTPAL